MTNLAALPPIADAKPLGSAFAGVQVRLDASQLARIERMFLLAPDIIGTYMRDVMGQWGGSFRRQLLAQASPGMRRLARQSVFYQLRPKQAKKRGVAKAALTGYKFTAKPSMDNITLRIYSTSQVTLLHEVGGTITAKDGGSMALPARGSKVLRKNIKPRQARFVNLRGKARREKLPSALKNAGAKLTRVGSVLYRTSKGPRGTTYEPTHILVRKVRIKAALGVIRTWNSLEGDRNARLQKAVDGAALAMAAQVGKTLNSAISGALRAVA